MLLKYLKDQGGQFWGAFAQSYANAVEKAKDRPLKEAMMKAQIGHYNAVNAKLEQDAKAITDQNNAMSELTNILTNGKTQTSTTYEKPMAEMEATNYGETNPPAVAPDFGAKTQTTTRPATAKEILPHVLKAGGKGVMDDYLKTLIPPATLAEKFGVKSMADAQIMEMDPDFKRMFPYGHRWDVKNGMLVPIGQNPVNTVDQQMHRWQVENPNATADQVIAQRNKYISEGASASTFGTETTRNDIRNTGPGSVNIPGVTSPAIPGAGGGGATAPTPQREPGSNPYMNVKEKEGDIRRSTQAIPEGKDKRINAFRSMVDNLKTVRETYGNDPKAAETIGPIAGPMSDVREKWGETPVVGGLIGGPISDTQIDVKQVIQRVRNILRHEEFGGALSLHENREAEKELTSIERSPKSFVTRLANVERIMQNVLNRELETANVSRGDIAKGKLPQSQAMPPRQNATPSTEAQTGESVIHHPKGDFVVRNGAVFKVK